MTVSAKTLSVWACGDWSHPYLTMDFKTEANIIRAGQNHRQRSPAQRREAGALVR
ncbi:MAG: hypothetical protein ACLT78_11915 [Escherichia coli]